MITKLNLFIKKAQEAIKEPDEEKAACLRKEAIELSKDPEVLKFLDKESRYGMGLTGNHNRNERREGK